MTWILRKIISCNNIISSVFCIFNCRNLKMATSKHKNFFHKFFRITFKTYTQFLNSSHLLNRRNLSCHKEFFLKG